MSGVDAPTLETVTQAEVEATVAAAHPSKPPAVRDRHVPTSRNSRFRNWLNKWEAKLSRLSTRNNFWHRFFAWLFLPLAFRSGIKMQDLMGDAPSVVLPFRRFNKNWYSAMAGAALLGNSEVAGGMYVFKRCGGDYTVVCKHMDYKFLRPCYGPAVYKITPEQDIEALARSGEEFNIDLRLDVVQAVTKGEKERRVGRCHITFHATPKDQARARMQRRLEKLRDEPAEE